MAFSFVFQEWQTLSINGSLKALYGKRLLEGSVIHFLLYDR